jgi:recombination protein RecT
MSFYQQQQQQNAVSAGQVDYETGEYTPAPVDPRDLEVMAQSMAQAAPAQKGLSPADAKLHSLQNFKGELVKMLPAHVSVDAFVRVATTAIKSNPDLAMATDKSVFMALLSSAKDGLMPDGREAAIVTYRNNKGGTIEAQYQVMIDGVLKKVRQSRLISNVAGKAVFENDEFDYFMDENGEHIHYKPNHENPGKFRLAFAFAKYKDSGELVVEVMSQKEIERVKSVSRSSSNASSPWAKWYDRMAVKSALHRLARRLPNSAEVAEMLERDIQFEAFDNGQQTKASAPVSARKPQPL